MTPLARGAMGPYQAFIITSTVLYLTAFARAALIAALAPTLFTKSARAHYYANSL